MSYYGFKKRPPKGSDLSAMIKKVDSALSEVVRLRACDSEMECVCVTCGAKDHYLRMHCGHFIPRANMSTRFYLKNVNVQCPTCNCVMDGFEEKHADYIDKTYGEYTSEHLRALGLEEKKWSQHELAGMLEELRTEAKALKEEKLKS